MGARRLLLSYVLLLCLPLPGIAATLHVPGSFATIQSAIDAASPGDEVIVATGTYTGAGNRDLDLHGKAIVLRSSSGPTFTIIDCAGSPSDPHRGFYFHSNESSASVVEGFTIRNGYAIGPAPAYHGGGVYLENASPTLRDCVFENNTAARDGGGIHSRGGTSPVIQRCRFAGNHAEWGGGFAGILGGPITLEDCSFEDNVATGRGGGAAFVSAYPSPTLRRCLFQENHASSGGGASFEYTVDPVVEGCNFAGNSASDQGGGVYIQWSAPSDVSEQSTLGVGPTVFTGCRFESNTAPGGAGLYASQMSPDLIMTGCTFWRNIAAASGGAIYITDVPLRMSSSTLAANGATTGSGIYIYTIHGPTDPIIERSILAFGASGGAVFCDGGGATLRCTDVFGNAGGDWSGCIASQSGVGGNLSANPLFCGVETGDLRLSSSSPCTRPQLPSLCGTFIGAWGVGCGTASVSEQPQSQSSWGNVKHRYH